MTPFCWVGGGGDQENSTSLSPATAPNISGALGAVFLTLVDYYILTFMYGIIIYYGIFLPVTFKVAESFDGLLLATVQL